MRNSCVLIVALSFLTIACGEEELVAVPSPEPPEEIADPSPLPPPPADPEPAAPSLEATSPSPLFAEPHAKTTVSVRLTGEALALEGQELRYRIAGSPNGARLGAARAHTCADGRAHMDLVTGNPAVFQIRVESDIAPSLRIEVIVREPDPDKAGLIVRAAYRDQAAQPVDTVLVKVFDGQRIDCEAALRADEGLTPLERHEMDLTGTLRLDRFDHEQSVTLVALGRNSVATVATGCVDGLVLEGGSDTAVEVRLRREGLDPTGVYAMRTTLDTRGAVPGQAGEYLDLFASLFEHPDDPARFMVTMLEERSGLSFGFMRETAITYVDKLFRALLPASFWRVVDLVGDAAHVVGQMSFEGTLSIKETWDGRLLATERWETVLFRWREACDGSREPGCELQRVELRNTHIGEMVATYDVSVDDRVLRFETHERSIQYARLFHLFILRIVYPYIVPGATDTSSLLRGVMDCAAIAETLDEADGAIDGFLDIGIARLSVAAMEGYCDGGLGAVGAMVDGLLDSLAAKPSSTLTLSGAARMIDETQDLRPDALVDGSWTGTLTLDEDERARGNFSAVRLGD